jgi:RNA polymerase sigma factor (sigma-70 family)
MDAQNLAVWLTRTDQDVTQEASLRASRFLSGYQGGNMRTWWLTIVRNTCYTWSYKNLRRDSTELLNGEIHSSDLSATVNSEIQVQLPDELREAHVLREIEGMSYEVIADVTSVSIGAVMSRLARARTQLRQTLSAELSKGY